MPGRDIIVIGASAGGVEALTRLVRALPADLPAAVFVVLHVPAHGTSLLPGILTRNGPLPARHPDDGDPIRPGQIYIAPPDNHLLLGDGKVRIVRGPRENGHRPAVDPLFRTSARWHGNRVIGVVLSGTLDDGSAGLVAVKDRGGLAVVQDPDDALYPGMPRSALEAVEADYTLAADEIGAALVRLVAEPIEPNGGGPMPGDMEMESRIAEFQLDAIQDENRPGTPSGFGCPDCGGSLWELHEGELVRFRCRVGHAWTANSLVAEQSESVETALWVALRALEERAALCHRIGTRLRRQHSHASGTRFEEQAREAKRRAEVLRQVLMSEPPTNAEISPGTSSPSRFAGPAGGGLSTDG